MPAVALFCSEAMNMGVPVEKGTANIEQVPLSKQDYAFIMMNEQSVMIYYHQ